MLVVLNHIRSLTAPGQWKKPQSFYIKYEADHIEHEIAIPKKERKKIIELKKYMVSKGLLESDEMEKTEQRGKASYNGSTNVIRKPVGLNRSSGKKEIFQGLFFPY